MATINVSAQHIDTCLSCYLTDHHNRDGELLVGIEPRGQSVADAVTEAQDEAFALLDGNGPSLDADLVALAFRIALDGVDLKPVDETSPGDDDDSSDRAQVWILLSWETV
jgi:hypothetical protein